MCSGSPVEALPGSHLLVDVVAGLKDQRVERVAVQPVTGLVTGFQLHVREPLLSNDVAGGVADNLQPDSQQTRPVQ
ncbi:hypothetical protein KG918_003481 [Salmonella enterica]|nr:hypothetical protein [Salmonella enterica]EEF4030860.1 hypothetical protein [Salmonella enterica]EEJ5984375.1 hypothetical protein [Salmonella enterica]EEU3911203.1 hypothetical protein [Salmonella enterica]EGY4498215.1 hypothetical protein [Salmonella enterica]